MRALIDADILLYEIGNSSQSREIVTGEGYEIVPRSWDFCQQLFDNKIKEIEFHVGATEKSLLFLTNSRYINKLQNKKRKYEKGILVDYVHNFRDEVATIKQYKSGRREEKPFHYKNLIAYILGAYDFHVNERGLEADDAMCIFQTEALADGRQTIICSRDKDVRQCQGLQYSWECGQQRAIGPVLVNGLGDLTNVNEGKFHKTTGKKLPIKVLGYGPKFFYYQMLTGDSVDSVIGVMGRGPTFAYNLLNSATTEWECYQLTAEVYVKAFGDEWETKWREMADLLWMIKEVRENAFVRWERPPMDVVVV